MLLYDYEGRGRVPYGTRESALWDKIECPIVGESGPDPWTGKKSQRLLGSDSTVLQACVLGLSLQGWISIQNRPPLTMKWDCLISLPHRVIRATILFINLDVCLVFYHVWIVVAYIEWLNQLESWKLKLESKDLLFIAFQQKENQSLTKPCIV